MKTMSVRLADGEAEALAAVAQADAIPVSQFVRDAIKDRIAERRKDVEFQERLRSTLERNREVLEALINGTDLDES